jgi:hypothetical protein
MGNDVGGFEEPSGAEADNMGWWLTPVEVPLFEGRQVADPVVGLPGSRVQVPAATEPDEFAISIKKRAARDSEVFVRKLVPIIDRRQNPGKPMRREQARFLVKSECSFHCRVLLRCDRF